MGYKWWPPNLLDLRLYLLIGGTPIKSTTVGLFTKLCKRIFWNKHSIQSSQLTGAVFSVRRYETTPPLNNLNIAQTSSLGQVECDGRKGNSDGDNRKSTAICRERSDQGQARRSTSSVGGFTSFASKGLFQFLWALSLVVSYLIMGGFGACVLPFRDVASATSPRG